MKNEYIITVAYGEYDDYNVVNLAIAEDESMAYMIVTSLNEGDPEFRYLYEQLDLYEPIENCTFSCEERKCFTWEDLYNEK